MGPENVGKWRNYRFWFVTCSKNTQKQKSIICSLDQVAIQRTNVLYVGMVGPKSEHSKVWKYESFDLRKKFSNLPLIQDNSSWSKNLFSKILNNHGFSISTFIKAVSISCREIDGYEKDKDCDFLHHFQSFLGFSRVFSSKLSSLVDGSLYNRSLSRSNCRFIGQIIVYSNGKVAELKALAEKFEYFFHKK